MKRIYSMDIGDASVEKGIICYHDGDFVGVVIFNTGCNYQIVKSGGYMSKEYSMLSDLIQENTLYNFYQL